MKKLLTIAMTAAMLLSAMAIGTSAAEGTGSYGEVPMCDGNIVIDGKMDEIYNLGLKIDASQDYADQYATDTTADLYLLRDGEYLYIFYDVKSAYDIDPAKYNPDNATPRTPGRAPVPSCSSTGQTTAPSARCTAGSTVVCGAPRALSAKATRTCTWRIIRPPTM